MNSIPVSKVVKQEDRFLVATHSRPVLKEVSENFKSIKYEIQAKRVFANLPKRMQSMTASVVYCKHTNTQLSVSTGFTNCPELTNFIPHEHGIFSSSLPLGTALTIYNKAHTTTEKYIAMTAILVKTKIIDTRDTGLMLDSEQLNFLLPTFKVLIKIIEQCLTMAFTLPIDSLKLDEYSYSNEKRLKTHFKEVAQAIDTANFCAGGTRLLENDRKQDKQLKLDDEVALEQELSKLLTDFGASTSKRYDKRLNSWTRRALQRSDMTKEQVVTSMKILNTHPDSLKLGTVEAILPTVTSCLCYEDDASRRNSALVIRHLEYKIELQLACLYKSGFVAEIVKEEVTNDKTLMTYARSTRVIEDKIVAKISVSSSSALEKLRATMAKFGGKVK